MTFYSSSVALLWWTAIGAVAPRAAGSQASRRSIEDLDEAIAACQACALERLASAAKRECELAPCAMRT